MVEKKIPVLPNNTRKREIDQCQDIYNGKVIWKNSIFEPGHSVAELRRYSTYLLKKRRRRPKSPIKNYKTKIQKNQLVSSGKTVSCFNFFVVGPFMHRLPTCNTKISTARRRLVMFPLGAARFHLR